MMGDLVFLHRGIYRIPPFEFNLTSLLKFALMANALPAAGHI